MGARAVLAVALSAVGSGLPRTGSGITAAEGASASEFDDDEEDAEDLRGGGWPHLKAPKSICRANAKELLDRSSFLPVKFERYMPVQHILPTMWQQPERVPCQQISKVLSCFASPVDCFINFP
jgi:hypothetical protein